MPPILLLGKILGTPGRLRPFLPPNANVATGTIFHGTEGARYAASCVSAGRCPTRQLLPYCPAVVSCARRLLVPVSCPFGHMQLIVLALLVTCARVPLSVLQGESISVNNGPSPSNGEPRSPFLLVSGGRSLLWSFPVDECLSWFVSVAANSNSQSEY